MRPTFLFIRTAVTGALQRVTDYWRAGKWQKLLLAAACIGFVSVATMYGIARWYIAQEKDRPMVWGVSFIPAYAESLGLDAKATMDALIEEAGVRHFRLVSYWNQHEPAPGAFDFSLLDWQFAKAQAAGAKVTLAIGLRQPRWPECHIPDWAANIPDDGWQPFLDRYIAQVVDRYKDSPALDSYQLENEYFLRGFGICTNFDRARLVREYDLVKRLDPRHNLIVSRSNNAIGFPVGEPTPDEFGISIYKRVWDHRLTKRYLEYPFPAWYYAFLAGVQKIFLGRDMVVHELQAEAWTPNYQSIGETSLAEQNKSFNAVRFKDRVRYAQGTGMREIYLWGSEYWYYRLQHDKDASLWDVARETFRSAR